MALLNKIFGYKSEFNSRGGGPCYYWWDPGRSKNNKKVIITAIIITIIIESIVIKKTDNYIPVDSNLNEYEEWVTYNGYNKRNTDKVYAYLDEDTNTLIEPREFANRFSLKVFVGLLPGLLIFLLGYASIR